MDKKTSSVITTGIGVTASLLVATTPADVAHAQLVSPPIGSPLNPITWSAIDAAMDDSSKPETAPTIADNNVKPSPWEVIGVAGLIFGSTFGIQKIMEWRDERKKYKDKTINPKI